MSRDEINQEIIRNIDVFDEYFNENGITVESELLKEKARVEALFESEKNQEERSKLQNLINAYDEMIINYNESILLYDTGISTNGVYHPVYSVAVASIVTYFTFMKYYLSAELLTYAKTTSTGGLLKPSQANIINKTSELARIKNAIRGQESGSGYGEFKKGGAAADNDLYYAIHFCDYSYDRGKLTITDYYDFAFDDTYSGLAGTAVDTMAMAQLLGVIVPYDIQFDSTY